MNKIKIRLLKKEIQLLKDEVHKYDMSILNLMFQICELRKYKKDVLNKIDIKRGEYYDEKNIL